MKLSDFFADLFFVLGAVAIIYGTYLVFPPAGWIVGGMLAGGAGWVIGR